MPFFRFFTLQILLRITLFSCENFDPKNPLVSNFGVFASLLITRLKSWYGKKLSKF